MKAMILAAGLGTRLRPLTNHRPKALVEVAGRTLLEIALARLDAFGIGEVIVNAHHFADMIARYLEANNNFGMTIEVSREQDLLDTGGGLRQAAGFFLRDAPGDDQPFLLHNVDVLSDIDLDALARFHLEQGALATLAVQQRPTSRGLLFDANGQLLGRADTSAEMGLDAHQARAFCGIHVISPAIFAHMPETGAFSIIDAWLRLAAAGKRIVAYPADGCYWRDLGTPAGIHEAEHDLKTGRYAAD